LLTCDYQFADGANELLVWVMPATAMERARKQFKDLTPVKNLGEEAFTHHDETFDYTVVYFRKGNAVVEIGVPAAAKDGASKVKALAAKAAGRLQAG
jgi:hypothetical protein